MTHEELQKRFEAHATKYPQYKSWGPHLKKGVMQRTFRKNFCTYLKTGDNVLFFREKDDATVFGVDQEDKESFYSVPHHWVKEAA
jgi:hypothetical protein